MPSPADSFYQQSTALIAATREKNQPVITALAPIIGRNLAAGGMLHVFGSGHSEVLAREIISRAGGLVCVNGVLDPTGGFIENLVGYGTALAGRYDRRYELRPGETIIVISNSGKNSAPIEVALYAKEKGLNIVGLTSVAMSSTAKTVHPGGKNLHAIAHHTLDNFGVPGDTLIDLGDGLMSGPTSTLVGGMLLNLLMLETMTWMRAQGHPLPVLRSQNLPGAIAHTRQVGERYKHRLSKQLA
ncbi:MAG: sugar isomerase domain-containing protein [Opitutaceae bacterium]|nr:sugar isomerase domain-containing protein [Opitutaceae bacterium]